MTKKINLHPMQPLVRDRQKVIRFRENKMVRHLLDEASRVGLYSQSVQRISSKEDAMQFSQLIGCSVSGYGNLSYVSKASLRAADKAAAALRGNEIPIRDKFEAWYVRENNKRGSRKNIEMLFELRDGNDYGRAQPHLNDSWEVWQAATKASLS